MAKQPKTKPQKKFSLKPKLILLGSGLTLLVVILITVSFYLYFLNRIYPTLYIGNISLGGLTKEQAKTKLGQVLSQRLDTPLAFRYQNQTYSLNLHSLITPEDESRVINKAFAFGHTTFSKPSPITMSFSGNSLDSQIKSIEQSINKGAVNAKLTVNTDQITVTPSQIGYILDEAAFIQSLNDYLNTGILPQPQLPLKTDYPALSYNDALGIKAELNQIKLTPLQLVYTAGVDDPDNQTFSLDLPTLLSLIDLNHSKSDLMSFNALGQNITLSSLSYGDQNLSDTKLTLDPVKTASYLQDLAAKINRPVKEPVFTLDPSAGGGSGKVTDFQPPQEGKELDINKTYSLLSARLSAGDLNPLTLAVNTMEPKNKLTNQLGIKELLGEGVSRFAGSSSDRIFNLELAASRINGTLVAPGETFSFDQSVGDISAANGYHEGYVIKSGKTVLDDGGGVCQDPTTLFRAVLNAGLPVVARTAHAYRVYYYEEGFPPGIDATIFQPSVDFKFKNDTGHYILISTSWNNATDTLYYDLWGTSDGRVSKVSTPVILSSTPAPPDVHQPDPTKPKGTVTQVDFASGGARVVFSRTVSRDGQTLINEKFYSNYTPQANVYLDGTL